MEKLCKYIILRGTTNLQTTKTKQLFSPSKCLSQILSQKKAETMTSMSIDKACYNNETR